MKFPWMQLLQPSLPVQVIQQVQVLSNLIAEYKCKNIVAVLSPTCSEIISALTNDGGFNTNRAKSTTLWVETTVVTDG